MSCHVIVLTEKSPNSVFTPPFAWRILPATVNGLT